MVSDAEKLIKLAQDGDAAAFEQLVRNTENMVYRTAFAVLGNEEDAKDASQETYIKLWKGLRGFRGDSSFTTWLYMIAKNTALDMARKSMRRGTVSLTRDDPEEDDDGEETDIPDSSDSPEDAAVRAELGEEIGRAMSRLTYEHREIITLRDIEGYTYEEIADMLSIDCGTVKSRINRARSKLRSLLGNVI